MACNEAEGWLSTRSKQRISTKKPVSKCKTSLPKKRPSTIGLPLTQNSPPPKELFKATRQAQLSQFFTSRSSTNDASKGYNSGDQTSSCKDELPTLNTRVKRRLSPEHLPSDNNTHKKIRVDLFDSEFKQPSDLHHDTPGLVRRLINKENNDPVDRDQSRPNPVLLPSSGGTDESRSPKRFTRLEPSILGECDQTFEVECPTDHPIDDSYKSEKKGKLSPSGTILSPDGNSDVDTCTGSFSLQHPDCLLQFETQDNSDPSDCDIITQVKRNKFGVFNPDSVVENDSNREILDKHKRNGEVMNVDSQAVENELIFSESSINKTELVSDAEYVIDTESVIDTETIICTEAVIETEYVIETEAVIDTESVSDTESVIDTQTIIYTEAVIDTESVIDVNHEQSLQLDSEFTLRSQREKHDRDEEYLALKMLGCDSQEYSDDESEFM